VLAPGKETGASNGALITATAVQTRMPPFTGLAVRLTLPSEVHATATESRSNATKGQFFGPNRATPAPVAFSLPVERNQG
jgi:hypothetical protein